MHRSNPKLFYGYWIVLAGFICVFVASFASFYAFGLFVKPIQATFDWGRGNIMLGYTVFSLVAAVVGPIVGKAADRFGPRRIIFIGAIFAGGGFLLLSQVNALWSYYLTYVVIALGTTSLGMIPASYIVSNWFKKRRGLAVGTIGAGISTVALVLAPIIGGYIIPNFGWRTCFIILGIATIGLVIPMALFVLRTRPEEKGLQPDGKKGMVSQTSAKAVPVSGLSLKAAMGTASFWFIGLSFFVSGFGHISVIQSQVAHLDDIGFPTGIAVTALSCVGLGSLLGKFIVGWLCDRMTPKYAWAVGLTLQATAIIILSRVTPTSSLVMIYFYAIAMGLGVGGLIPSMSILASATFGLASYGSIYGMLTMFIAAGGALGPVMAGFMYDAAKSYYLAFMIFASLYALAIPAALLIRRPQPKPAESVDFVTQS